MLAVLIVPCFSAKAANFDPNLVISDTEATETQSFDADGVQTFLEAQGSGLANYRALDTDGLLRREIGTQGAIAHVRRQIQTPPGSPRRRPIRAFGRFRPAGKDEARAGRKMNGFCERDPVVFRRTEPVQQDNGGWPFASLGERGQSQSSGRPRHTAGDRENPEVHEENPPPMHGLRLSLALCAPSRTA